jgi:hypothetical protein
MGLPGAAGAVPRPEISEAQADLLSLDAVISTGAGIAGEKWSATAVPGNVFVSRNLDPLPRVRFASAWNVLPREEILSRVKSAEYDPRRSVLLASEPAALGKSEADSGAIVSLPARENGPGDWVIDVPTGARGIVVVAESFDPGWRASDAAGNPVETFLADGYFVAFAAPERGGAVRLRYDPPELLRGALLSLAALLVALVLLIRSIRATSALRREPEAPGSSLVPAFVPWAVIAGGLLLLLAGAATSFSGTARALQSPLPQAAVRTWCAEAQGAYRAGAWDAAASLLERAASIAPDDATIEYRQGLVERARERPESANRHFERAAELDPTLQASRETHPGPRESDAEE